MWLSRTWKLSVQPHEIGKSLKRFVEDSRCETSSGKVHAGLQKLPFCKVKVWHFFSERVTDRLTRSLYNFAHFLVSIVKSLTAIALVWYRAGRAQLLVPVFNMPELVSHTVTATTCAYCPAPFHLPYWASMSNSETLLERHQWRERETTAAETWDERATTLCHLCVAISLMLAPQCSTISLVIYHGCM